MSKIIEEKRYVESKWDAFKNFIHSFFGFIGKIIVFLVKLVLLIVKIIMKIIGIIFKTLSFLVNSVNLIFTLFKIGAIVSIGLAGYYGYQYFKKGGDVSNLKKDSKNAVSNIKSAGQSSVSSMIGKVVSGVIR